MRTIKFIKYLLVPVIVGFLVFLYGFTSRRNGTKKIEKLAVKFKKSDSYFLNDSVVNKLLIQNNLSVKNQTKSVIDLHRLESNILTNPYVEEATVFVTINGVLHSNIKQRTPLVRVLAKNKSYYLDAYGVKVPLSTNYSARVPLVTGIEKDANVTEVLKLMKAVLADSFLKKEIVGIHKSKQDEYQFTVRSGDYRIDFGKPVNIDLKFKKLKAFYSKALVDKTINNYKNINVKYHNQVVCTKINQNGKQ